MQDAQLIQANNEHKLLMLYQQFIGVSAQQQQQLEGRIYIDKWRRDTLWKKKHENKVFG